MLSSVEEKELVEDINRDDSFGEDQTEETDNEDKEKGRLHRRRERKNKQSNRSASKGKYEREDRK